LDVEKNRLPRRQEEVGGISIWAWRLSRAYGGGGLEDYASHCKRDVPLLEGIRENLDSDVGEY
jgi:hypothetical protein